MVDQWKSQMTCMLACWHGLDKVCFKDWKNGDFWDDDGDFRKQQVTHFEE